MIDTKKIIEAAERNLQGTDMYVVGCTCTPGNDIELLIDSDTSVAIDACVRLSRSIEEELDRDEEDFSLTVASAGIGSELKCLRQYRKLVGSTVEVLLTSGITLTWAHWGLMKGKRSQLNLGLILTVLLGVIFLGFQAYEYHHAYTELGLTMGAGVYGATFFMLTGFHGFHVTLGTIMLAVVAGRCLAGHFDAKRHFAFEAVAWYWHFVDVVWLLLFVVVYWL